MKASIKIKVATAVLSTTLVMGSIAWPSAAEATYAAQSIQTATVQYGVNMRTKDSTAGKVIRMLRKGETVTINYQSNSGWYQVTDRNGVSGFVSNDSKYLDIQQTTTPEQPTNPVQPVDPTPTEPTNPNQNNGSQTVLNQSATVIYGVNMRTAPVSGKVIRMLSKGEQVQIVGQAGAGWYQVKDARGTSGYVSASSKYLQIAGEQQPGNNNGNNNNNSNNNNGGNNGGSQTSNATVEKIIAAGMKYLGTPYEFGSSRSSTRTFDCSAFVQRAFLDVTGKKIPGDSRKQGQYVKDKGNAKYSISSLKRGDLMFFMSYKGSSASSYSGLNKSSQRITHVGIYLGNNQILHTYSKESGGVKVDTFTGKHWEHRFLYGGSAL
ncbi:SH3 domain-containing protein [Paenibacillus yanchengensis]|uniref:SH3 domain-containing protein n=1 Tax=Paenibacillus yanchengensis TaxID=2035833 RepID=A0ABW4YJ05_9BACL